MKTTRTIIFIITILLFVCNTLVSCTPNPNEETINVDNATNENTKIIQNNPDIKTANNEDDDEVVKDPLRIYLMNWDTTEINAIRKFNDEVKNKTIDGRLIEITEFEDNYKLNSRLGTEIMVGKGPDIIYIKGDFFWNDFGKVSEQNVFADMNLLANNSETFNFDDYNEMVMNAGIFDSKRYLMPISYSVPFIFTTKEVFKNNNMQIPEKLNFENLFSIITEYEKNNPMKAYRFTTYLWYDVCSQNQSKIDIDSDIFEKYMKRMREVYIENDNEVYLSNIYNGVCSADELLFFEYYSNSMYNGQFRWMAHLYNKTNISQGNNIVFLEMPSNQDGITKAYIDKSIVINNNSKYKDDAFKFVEYLMSYDFAVNNNDYISIPVNKKAYEEYKRIFTTQTKDIFNPNSALAEVIPSDLAKKCISIVENVSTCEFDVQKMNIICSNEAFNTLVINYFRQKIDYDTMIAQFKNKLELYYSE